MPLIDSELQYALNIFSRFFELLHQPLAIINPKGKYIYYNQESADLDGYTIKQALGHHMLDVYPNMKPEQSTMLEALKTGKEFINSYQVYTNAKGQSVDYQHTTVPLYDKNDNVLGVIEIGQDMSGLRQLQEQVIELNERLYHALPEKKNEIVTQNRRMQQQITNARRLAKSDVPVIIIGETGTGKELFAKLLHDDSDRAKQPFIALNCAALPGTLIESTLFGTVKGAFTGAQDNKGYFELADKGTLFLDELNSMPLDMQVKLLRFLQDKTFWKLGGSKPIQSDVRIVVAMNETPTKLIQEGRLRQDLFYRLNVGMIILPSLRERDGDIPLLCEYLIEKNKKNMPHKITGITPTALKQLEEHDWPGNIRMLENVLVRNMLMQEQDGLLQHIAFDEDIFWASETILPLEPEQPAYDSVKEEKKIAGTSPYSLGNLTQQVEQFERQLIVNALNQSNSSIAAAARVLNVSRTALHYKIKKYAIRLGVQE